MTTRVCFQLRVDPNRLDEHRRRHAAVWPTGTEDTENPDDGGER